MLFRCDKISPKNLKEWESFEACEENKVNKYIILFFPQMYITEKCYIILILHFQYGFLLFKVRNAK